MSATLAVNTNVFPSWLDATTNTLIVQGTITLTGNYGGAATHGDTLNFSTLIGNQSNSIPKYVELWEAPAAGTAPTGYLFLFCPGTTPANGVLCILNNLTEYTQGSAYNAALLGVTLNFLAYFPVQP
jgi:hypothetical protein